MKTRAALTASSASPSLAALAARPAAPLWAVAAALALGVLAALLPSSGHVHSGRHGSWAHQHFFTGPHSHPPEKPAGDRDGGSKAPAERDDAQVVALAPVASLAAASPALPQAAAAPFRPPLAPAPALPRAAGFASPFSPRGPPRLPC